jgi:lipid II:glycine glycyltransferase (peptidoglycan interpeptide bridge formation enzyme)
MVRFRVETIPLVEGLEIDEEREFLNSAMEYFRSLGADMVIPATTNTIFRTYPDTAVAAPYGSYIIDLRPSEDVLWRNIDRILRQNIKTASKTGVIIREAMDRTEEAYLLIKDTFKRSRITFMSLNSFKRYLSGLGEHGKILVADFQGVPQSFVVFGYSRYSAYAIYAGNVANQQKGANKLLYWEAIRLFKSLGVRRYDFVGARVNPEKNSKQEALSLLKKRFGSTLKQGYMWKFPLHPFKYHLYRLAARIRSGGDIVDYERHKLKDFYLSQ